jgi:hypothetical protein
MTGRQKGNDGPEKGRAPVSIARKRDERERERRERKRETAADLAREPFARKAM